MNREEIHILVNAQSSSETEKKGVRIFTFYFDKIKDRDRCLRLLQENGYPACQNKLGQEYFVRVELHSTNCYQKQLRDASGDVMKVTANAPRDTLAKHTVFDEIGTVWPPEKPEAKFFYGKKKSKKYDDDWTKPRGGDWRKASKTWRGWEQK